MQLLESWRRARIVPICSYLIFLSCFLSFSALLTLLLSSILNLSLSHHPSVQFFPQYRSSRKLPPLQSAATLQVSILTEPWCSGEKMEMRFMMVWKKEISSQTMMAPSRLLLIWMFHQSNLKTGGDTSVCVSVLEWWEHHRHQTEGNNDQNQLERKHT